MVTDEKLGRVDDDLVDEIARRVRSANGRVIPQWAARTAFAILGVLLLLLWGYLIHAVDSKADDDKVQALAGKLNEIKCDVDYLKRKAEADAINAAVSRRVLDDLAERAGVKPGGPLVQPRPSEHGEKP